MEYTKGFQKQPIIVLSTEIYEKMTKSLTSIRLEINTKHFLWHWKSHIRQK